MVFTARLETSPPVAQDPSAPEALVRAAFREVHGRRLHGFALIVSLGDRELAARLVRRALADGVAQASSLRHPERGASWLRHRVLRGVPRRLRNGPTMDERRAALAAVGVSHRAFDALAGFSTAERATLVAGNLEGLGQMDLERIMGSRRAASPARILEARRRFLVAHFEAANRQGGEDRIGPLGERVMKIARQALAGRPA